MPRRWDSALIKASSDIRSPLNTDHYPLVAEFRAKLAAPQDPHDRAGRVAGVTEEAQAEYASQLGALLDQQIHEPDTIDFWHEII
eukprot:12063102-Alexandrium_andersonii.AAC.1